jgi:2-C-methyl-D-erythritol 4-phosphate cytidylyltransferase/2-C-methyl-D-erythritol 2,4-cyclodiphosphate synthase
MSTLALLVAAGRGDRFGSAIPKQYLTLGGSAILRRTIQCFLAHPRIDAVQVVIQPEHRELYEDAVAGLDIAPPVMGAQSRQASTKAGLEAWAGQTPELVLIHDAVRPLVDFGTIERVLEALDEASGVVPGLMITDTLRRAEAGISTGTVDRTNLWRMQTPQGFHYDVILAAHRAATRDDYTDDAAVLEATGQAVRIVPGHINNMKITTPENLTAAEQILMNELNDIRTGMGFDVHEFGPGTSIMICGVEIPHTKTAVGHSDADVGLHALTDAIFGAIGEGDIGTHFPPSDPQWRGADSAAFLKHAASLVAKRGGIIANADITLLCEEPKIGPHRLAMKARVADILGIDVDRVAVKATTTEKMGFTGRSEGLAAQAIATVRLPGTK